MKKFAMLCLTLLLIASMSVSAFAVGNFVISPSSNPAPIVIDITPDSDDCDAVIVVTPYSERETLPDKGAELEDAYDDIKNTEDVSKLNEDLAALAQEKEIPGADLGVSDLFDISMTGCDEKVHEEENHGGFTVTLEAETLKDFVGLMYRDDEGNWVLVKDVVVEGDTMTFHLEHFGPYAIVVDTNPNRQPPFSGDDFYMLLWALLAAGSGMAMIFCWYQSRKKEA